MEHVPINTQTLAGTAADAGAVPKAVRRALAPLAAEAAVLLLRISAAAILASPVLLAAALLLG